MATSADVLTQLAMDVNATLVTMMKIVRANRRGGEDELERALAAMNAFTSTSSPAPSAPSGAAPAHSASFAAAPAVPAADAWEELRNAAQVFLMMHDTPTPSVAHRYESFKDFLRADGIAFEEVAAWGDSEENDNFRKLLMRISNPDRRWPLVFFKRTSESRVNFAGSHATLTQSA